MTSQDNRKSNRVRPDEKLTAKDRTDGSYEEPMLAIAICIQIFQMNISSVSKVDSLI